MIRTLTLMACPHGVSSQRTQWKRSPGATFEFNLAAAPKPSGDAIHPELNSPASAAGKIGFPQPNDHNSLLNKGFQARCGCTRPSWRLLRGRSMDERRTPVWSGTSGPWALSVVSKRIGINGRTLTVWHQGTPILLHA